MKTLYQNIDDQEQELIKRFNSTKNAILRLRYLKAAFMFNEYKKSLSVEDAGIIIN